ncbi:hypothetical protein SASPL_109143 [Salvia splendens]|uniref:Uncharacterized protein n=1 Tax=Salvia splendens TaxID=180675 RepID=A0A8X9A798_SALSN|nr:hypothetical protein SASPL_109143 [Salvia splendens]
MKSNLSITAPLSVPPLGSATTRILLQAPIISTHKKNFAIKAAASSSSSTNAPNPFLPHLKAASCAVIFSAATFWKLPAPALAQLPIPSDSIGALKALLEEKLDDCDDYESLSLLWKLAAAEPENENNALEVAEREMKPKEARDVRMIMAQMKFLQKEMEEAMRSYDVMAKEDDPLDFRPCFTV